MSEASDYKDGPLASKSQFTYLDHIPLERSEVSL